jgi:hypothetical protein
MKNIAVGLLLIVLGTSCFAQSNNDAQRIVGTWNSPDDRSTLTLNSNGTFTTSGGYIVNAKTGRYFVSNGKLIMIYSNNLKILYDYYLSSDGRVLFIENSDGDFWLDKQ